MFTWKPWDAFQSFAGRYGKTVPQIILRWLTQRNIVVLSKSSRKERMQGNINIFDFHLTKEDMEKIAMLDTGHSTFFEITDPKTVEMFMGLVEQRRGLC